MPSPAIFKSLRFWVQAFFTVFAIVFIYALINYKSRVIFLYPDYLLEPGIQIGNKCRIHGEKLNLVSLDLYHPYSLPEIAQRHPEVEPGGKWKPKGCQPWQKVAIIITYRDRYHHLKLILDRLHDMLPRQMVDYQIFLVEQAGTEIFNKGRLYNTGYVEALKIAMFDCFIFHDIDLLPEHDKNLYYCDEHARHLSAALDEWRYHVMFYNNYGGVIALNRANYKKLNGFANRFAGWGNEDDDMSARTYAANLFLTRPPYHIGRYKMVRHMKSARSETGYDMFMQWRYWWQIDGLNNLESTGCRVMNITYEPMYTNITVDVGRLPAPIRDDIPRESTLWFLWWFVP